MGELIRREAASDPKAFSGERLTASITGQIEVEHYHRYLIAREFCRDRDVLDVAAGEGYGSALISQIARSVVGVEIDVDAVAAAQREFVRPNLRYLQGDARALPLADASMDVAVSFETLEHLAEQDVFLAELRRVLRPKGLLIISTPDRDIYSPQGTAPNPFHVLELTRSEFQGLLRRHFTHAVLSAQRAFIGSVVISESQLAPARSYERRSENYIESSEHLSRAPYLVALASNADLPPLPNSVFVHRSDLDTDPKLRREAELAKHELLSRVEIVEERASFYSASLTEASAREAHAQLVINQLTKDVRVLRSQVQTAARLHSTAMTSAERLHVETISKVERLHAETISRAEMLNIETLRLAKHRQNDAERDNTHLKERLHNIEVSTLWRATSPLRAFGRRFPAVARTARRATKLIWWTITWQLLQRYRLRRNVLRLQQKQTIAPSYAPTPEVGVGLTISTATLPTVLPEMSNLKRSGSPVVSIIISTYGQIEATLRCLRSVVEYAPRCEIEIIVIDDAYNGVEDIDILERIDGINLIKNPANLGFLRSCNHAARFATGRYLYMLNNDTELCKESIDALVDLLEVRDDVGMVGSKLIFPDGRLQEAGGILWADGSAWNYGRGDDASRPEFNYVRQVDYCSGASIMIRRSVSEAHGGFNEAFAPAYYEDVDIAFQMRARKLKVLYQPKSQVVHYEGMSHGTDISSGVKIFQKTNQQRMLDIWGGTLAEEHFQNGQHLLRARDRAIYRKVILVVDHFVPEPDRDAGSRSTLGIMESLVDADWVVKFWPLNRAYSSVYTSAMEEKGIEILDHRWPGDFAAWIAEHGEELDHVLVVRPDTAVIVIPILISGTRAVLSFYGVDLHFARLRRQADVHGDSNLLIEAAKMERIERRVWRHFDVVIYPSEEEAEAVRRMDPGVLTRGIVPFAFEPFPARIAPPLGRDVLFVAGFSHPPNVDAAVFLIEQIIPMLEERIGGLRVVLAGSNPTDRIKSLAADNVEVTGYVTEEELATLYNRCRVSIVPLRFGAGVKGKVIQSLSFGLPLVTTSTGAQGIKGIEEIVPVREDAEGIVAAMAALMIDDDAWMAQSARQMAFSQNAFSRAAMQRSVLTALETAEAGFAARWADLA